MTTTTLIPVRCYTCNKVLGRFQTVYEKGIAEGRLPSEMFEVLDIRRMCCRMNMLKPAIILTPTEQERNAPGSIGETNRELVGLRTLISGLRITNVATLPGAGALEQMTSVESTSAVGGERFPGQIPMGQPSQTSRMMERMGGSEMEPPLLGQGPSATVSRVTSLGRVTAQPQLQTQLQLSSQSQPQVQQQVPPRPAPSQVQQGAPKPIATLESLGL